MKERKNNTKQYKSLKHACVLYGDVLLFEDCYIVFGQHSITFDEVSSSLHFPFQLLLPTESRTEC